MLCDGNFHSCSLISYLRISDLKAGAVSQPLTYITTLLWGENREETTMYAILNSFQ